MSSNSALTAIIPSQFPSPTGVGGEPPRPLSKVGEGEPSCYLDYTANLGPEWMVMPLYPPSKCEPRYIVLQCNCGRRIVPSSCMSLDCEHCKGQVSKRRANSVKRRILGSVLYQRKRHWTKTVIYTVFTVPLQNREKFLEKSLWKAMRLSAWGLLKEYFGAKYAVEASHPVGEYPSTQFHPHLNFIWVQKDGFRPFIDVDLLRQKWSEVLKVLSSDVYSQYSNNIGKIIHWIKYVVRTFPGTHKWTGCLRWYGKYPKMLDPQEYKCEDCGGKFRLIGWVLATDVDQWLEHGKFLGRAPPWERDEDIIHARPRKKGTSNVGRILPALGKKELRPSGE